MRTYLFHRSTIVIFAICILAVSTTAYYAGAFEGKNSRTNTLGVGNIQIGKNEIIEDSNWKENLLSFSDENHARSISSTTDSATIKTKKSAPPTETEKLGQDFFANYMLLKQNNLLNDEKAVSSVIQKTLDSIDYNYVIPKLYFSKDISTSKDNSLEEKKRYANTIASIIQTNMPKDDPATIALQALEENDPERIEEVIMIAKKYNNILNELVKTPVPSDIERYHLSLINSFSSILYVTMGMSTVFTDPVRSIKSLTVYVSSFESLQQSVLNINAYFDSQKIIFSSNEPAYIFKGTR